MGRTRFALPRLQAVVRSLIIVLCAAYVAQLVLQQWLGVPMVALLALSPGGLGLWQLATYVFVDTSSPAWFLFGLLFLYFGLTPFERDFGPRRTLQLCAVSALSASIPAQVVGFAVPGSPLLAGSGPLWYGAVAATAYLFGQQPVSLFGLLQMTARQLLYLLAGLSLLNFLASKNHTQLVAELGAMAGAIAFVRYLHRPRRRRVSTPPRRKPSGLRVIEGGGGSEQGPKWLN